MRSEYIGKRLRIRIISPPGRAEYRRRISAQFAYINLPFHILKLDMQTQISLQLILDSFHDKTRIFSGWIENRHLWKSSSIREARLGQKLFCFFRIELR